MNKIALVLPLALVACASLTPAQQSSSIDKACKTVESVHVAFSALALAEVVKGSIVQRERTAYAAAHVLCSDPAALTDPTTALVNITAAAVVMSAALKDAS